MTHLTPETLGALHDASLDARARAAAEAHLAGCAECRERLAELAAQDAALSRSLAHDPGEAYFATFADRVARRLADDARAGATPALSGWRLWLAPRRLAWAGSAVAVLIVAGIVAIQQEQPIRLPASGSAARATAPTPVAAPYASAPPGAATPSSPATPEAAKDEGAARQKSEAPRAPAAALRNAGAHSGVASGAGNTVGAAGTPSPRGAPSEPAPAQQNAPPFAAAPPTSGASPSSAARKALEREASGGAVSGAAPSRALINERRPGREEGPPPAAAQAPRAADQKTMTGLQELEQRKAAPMAMKPTASSFAPAPANRAADSLAMRLDVARDEAVSGAAIAADTLWSARALPFARVADSVAARSRRTRSARGLDVATGDWSRLALLVAPGSPAQTEARFRAAEAAHDAWSIAPTAARRAAARTAVDRALATPLNASRRELLLRWRSRLR